MRETSLQMELIRVGEFLPAAARVSPEMRFCMLGPNVIDLDIVACQSQ